MQIQLGFCSLTSPSPRSFPSLPKNYLGVQPHFTVFPLEVSQKHYWSCADGYTHLTLSLIAKIHTPNLPNMYVAPASEIITFLIGLFEWYVTMVALFIYLFLTG